MTVDGVVSGAFAAAIVVLVAGITGAIHVVAHPKRKITPPSHREGPNRWLRRWNQVARGIDERRSATQRSTVWANGLTALARDVRTGRSLTAAIDDLVTTGDAPTELAAFAARRRFGRTMTEGRPMIEGRTANDGAVAQRGRGAPLDGATGVRRELSEDPDAQLALAAIEISLTHGGRVASALDRAASTIAQRHALADERRAQAAQARMSARVLTLVGPAFAVWTAATDERVRSFLIGSPIGWMCILVGVGLNLCGAWWTRRLISPRPDRRRFATRTAR